MKKCSKCKLYKNNDLFVIEKWKKDNRKELCIQCFDGIRQKISQKRKTKIATPDGRAERDEYIIQKRNYRHTLEGQIKEKQYRENRKEKQKEYERKYYQNNKEFFKNKSLEWSKNNPEKKKVQRNKQNKKRQLNPVHNFHDRIRKRLIRVLNDIGLKKESRTQDILGYSAKELFNYLSKYIGQLCEDCKLIIIDKQKCQIDHIIPIGSAKTKEDVIKLNQLNNLRLICSSCNLNKVENDLKIIKQKRTS